MQPQRQLHVAQPQARAGLVLSLHVLPASRAERDFRATADILGSPMSQEISYHMTSNEFRQWGHAVIDWIAEYQKRVEALPVLAQTAPGQIRLQLPAAPPQK